MIDTALAQLRLGTSLLFGTRFSQRAMDKIIDGMLATRREFGSIGREARELTTGPALDEETRRDMQLRRFRKQAARAATSTPYYHELFKRIELNPARLTWEDVARIPLTPKADIRDHPGNFVCRNARPVFRTTTTGTTGLPTSVCFSAYEMSTYVALGTIGLLNEGVITDEDIAIISTSSRATLGNICAAGALARIGTLVLNGGLVDPRITLALLSERHNLPGKRDRVSVMFTYPSYLGELIEYGERLGYTPPDFGLRRINLGGEVVTEGVQERARKLFGEHVEYDTGYAMTEPWPLNGSPCEQDHLHFDPSQGLVEVHDQYTGTLAGPGEYGTIVSTPFYPFRETTLVLRYDTQDVVRVLDTPLNCNLKNLPAVSSVYGKLSLSVKHAAGWTYPRQIMEVLEGESLSSELPLPAPFGYWAVPGGVEVEVVIRQEMKTEAVARKIRAALEGQGVPVREVHLLLDKRLLRNAYPLRGDLHETSFSAFHIVGDPTGDVERARADMGSISPALSTSALR